MKKTYNILLILVFILIIPFSFAIPAMPHAFYGNVTNNGVNLGTGCMICTEINGNVIANDCITTDQVGKYGINRKLIAQNANNGDLIKFKIGPVYSDVTSHFSSGSVDELNLTFTDANCLESTFGNGVIDGTEECDGSDLGGQTCVSQGYESGTLSCNTNEGVFNTTACVGKESNAGSNTNNNGTDSQGGTTGGTTGGTATVTTTSYSSTNQVATVSQVKDILQGLNIPDNEVQEYVDTAKQGLLHVNRKLEVKKIVSSTGSVSYKSTFSLSVKNSSNKQLKDVKVVETIPKNIALNASEISSIHQFVVLKADPVLQFIVPSINVGETVTIPYTVDKNITKAEFEGMSGVASKATVVETPTNPPNNNTGDNNTSNTSGGKVSPGTGTTLPPDYVRPKGILSNTWRWIFIVLLIAFMFYLIFRHRHLTK